MQHSKMHEYMIQMAAAIVATQPHEPEALADRAAEYVLAVLAKADKMTPEPKMLTDEELHLAQEEPENQKQETHLKRRGHKSGD